MSEFGFSKVAEIGLQWSVFVNFVRFSPESCTVHLTFKCANPAEVDEIFGKVKATGASVEKEPFDAFWKQRYSTLRDPGSGVHIDIFADLP